MPMAVLTFHSQFEKFTLPTVYRDYCIGELVRIGSIIIFHQSKLSILCRVIFLVLLQGKFDIDHSWE